MAQITADSVDQVNGPHVHGRRALVLVPVQFSKIGCFRKGGANRGPSQLLLLRSIQCCEIRQATDTFRGNTHAQSKNGYSLFNRSTFVLILDII